MYGWASRLVGGTRSAITSARPGNRQRVRSGKLAAHEPAGFAATVAGGLADAAESVCLEQRHGTHVAADLVDTLATRVDRVAFQHGGAHGVRMPDRALQQLVHKAVAPEPRPHHEAHHRPRTLVLDVGDRPGVDQGAVGGLGCDRAPAGRLAIDVCQHPWARFAGAQRAHVRDTAGHIEAGIAVRHADASASAWLARDHERREVLPSPGRRQHLDSHAPRIGPVEPGPGIGLAGSPRPSTPHAAASRMRRGTRRSSVPGRTVTGPFSTAPAPVTAGLRAFSTACGGGYGALGYVYCPRQLSAA